MSFVQTISFESVALPLNSQSSNYRSNSRNGECKSTRINTVSILTNSDSLSRENCLLAPWTSRFSSQWACMGADTICFLPTALVLTPRRTPAANPRSNSWRSNASSPSSSQLSISSFSSGSSTDSRSMRRSNAPPSGSLLGRPTRARYKLF